MYLNKLGIDLIEYYKKYLPDYISTCKQCGDTIAISKDLIVKSTKKFCDLDCYMKYKKFYWMGQ